MSQNDDDHQNEEEEGSSLWKSCHVARGLRRAISTAAITDDTLAAPPFVVAFHLEEPMSIPILAQRTLWALNYVQCCLKKGEKGALISGIRGLQCDLEHNIVSMKASGATLQLMRMQLRLFHITTNDNDRATDALVNMMMDDEGGNHHNGGGMAAEEDDDSLQRENYMLLVVESPTAFSLRKAIQMTSGSANRKTLVDINYTDKRRNVWCDLAIHASHLVHCSEGVDDRVGLYGACLDWLHAPDGRGFSALFTMHAAMDWAKMHFGLKHPSVSQLKISGFDETVFSNGREDNFFTAQHIADCRRYHSAVDLGVIDTYAKKKKRGAAAGSSSNRGGRRRRGDMMMIMTDDDAAEAEESEEGEERIVPKPAPILPGCILPRCDIALDIILPIPIEGPPPFDDFRTRVKNFPQYASLRLLMASMRFSGAERAALMSLLQNDTAPLTDAKVKEIMLHAPLDTRSMLSGRDTELGRHMRQLIIIPPQQQVIMDALQLRKESVAKLESFHKGLRLTLAIVRTRAAGSDNYTNERVAAFNEFASGTKKREGCVDAYHEISHVFSNGGGQQPINNNNNNALYPNQHHTQKLRMGNCDDEAQRFIAKSISSCNAELNLKPDNLFLLMHLIYTDLMLSLDYHRSTLEAAPNGIGATLIVCDGGGNYRYDNMNLVYNKTNGTGADHVMNAFMKLVEVPRYTMTTMYKCDYFEELKHATELSIVQTVCNSYMGTGANAVVDKVITEAMKRTYATEFVANNSQGAMNCMKALSWLVERNTTMGGDNGVYKTTSETDEKKGRHTFVYKPAIAGLVLLCTNLVHPQCYERFHTIAQVSRKVASSAHVVTSADSKDEVDDTLMLRLSRPLFCNVMCTIVNVAFAQWTGALGHIPESPVMKAIVSVIQHQLDLSQHILNPDMTSADKKRFRQVSRARSIPVALMTLCARETGEAGRQEGGDYQMAIERACHALMTEGTISAAWWLTAEFLEHMLRFDFFCVMQMLAKAFQVPSDLTLNEVLEWIFSPPPAEPSRIQRFFDASEFMGGSLFEAELGTMTRVDHCLYLRHSALDVGGLNLLADATIEDHKALFCKKVGSILQGWSKRELADSCRIKDNETGRQIVSTMLMKCINEQFAWPSMLLGGKKEEDVVNFWKGGRHPGAIDCALAPLRMIHTSSGKATLGVDLRWLLLCASIGGCSPSQTQRFLIVRHLSQRIHQKCIPSRMITAPRLFIGLPHPDIRRGLDPLDITSTTIFNPPKRFLLLRHTRSMGMDAPVVRTKMIEDLGPAGPRLQLTRVLMGSDWTADSLPTESAHTPLPHGLWTPVLLERPFIFLHPPSAMIPMGSFAALKTNNDGIFWLSCRDTATGAVLPPFDVTADESIHISTFLYGRISVAARPLCIFDRPGVLVNPPAVLIHDLTRLQPHSFEIPSPQLATAIQSLRDTEGAIFYMALRWCNESSVNQLIEMDPECVWNCVVPPDTPLLVDIFHYHHCHNDDNDMIRVDHHAAAAGTHFLFCTLDSQGAPENLPPGSVFVRARGPRLQNQEEAFDDAGGILLPDEEESGAFLSFAVSIRCVAHIAASSDTRESFLAKAVGATVFFRTALFLD